MSEPKPSPPPLRLQRDADGRLLLESGGERQVVRARACFPWTEPGRFISLRDGEDREVVLVDEPGDLDRDSRQALGDAVGESRFVFEILAILSIEKEHELRAWQVDTRQGSRRFQTKLDDWPRPLDSGGWLIRDVAGDLFFVPDSQRLDKTSRQLLSGFID